MKHYIFIVFIAIVILQSITVASVAQGIDSGLVAYWPFPCCSLTDATGHGHNGTLTNSPTCVTGVRDQAFEFDGHNSIDVPFDAAFDIQQDSALTLSAWVNPTDINGAYQALVIKGSAVWDYGLYIDISGSFMFGSNWPNHETLSVTKPQNGQWYNVTGVYWNGNWKLFVNGRLENTVLNGASIGRSTHGISFGKKGDQFTDEFTGVLDEIRLYNRALTDSEVSSLYSYVITRRFDSTDNLTIPAIIQQFAAPSCLPIDTLVRFSDTGCSPGLLDSAWITGSPSIFISDSRRLPRSLGALDSIGLEYLPIDSGADSAVLHLRYDLGSGQKDTTITIVGSNNNTPAKLTMTAAPQNIFDVSCNLKDTVIRLGILGCGLGGGVLDSAWIVPPSPIRISDARRYPRALGPNDSLRLEYSPSTPSPDTVLLHIRYNLGSGTLDTTIAVIGILDSSLRALSFVIPASPNIIKAACTPGDTIIKIGIGGCSASSGMLDSAWIAGSPAITIGDKRRTPRTMSWSDSIVLNYSPDAHTPDTAKLHISYNIGNGIHDTIITVIGRIDTTLETPALTVTSATQSIILSSCASSDTGIRLALKGCPLTNDVLDSAWITGSPAIAISDPRSLPRPLAAIDSIKLQYSPSGESSDISQLHILYNLGSGEMDTVITISGSLRSQFLSGPVSLHREAGVSYYGSKDSLPLDVDINSSVNIDSIWPFLHDISCTYAFNSSVVKYSSYKPPNGWTLTSILNRVDSVDFTIHNSSSKTPSVPLDLGTAIFQPVYAQLSTSDVKLTKLIMDIGSESIEPCVIDDEDQHWSVKVLVTEGVEPSPDALSNSEGISIYPNPAGDELFVQNANADAVSITLYDAIGRAVLSANVAGSSNTTLGMEELPSGSYELVGHLGEIIITKRVSKIR